MLVIGSTASKLRDPEDLDVIASPEETKKLIGATAVDKFYSVIKDGKRLDIFVAHPNSAGERYLKHCNAMTSEVIAPLDVLLSIKNSHKYIYRGKFRKSFKHLMDYSQLLKVTSLTPELIELSKDWGKEFILSFSESELKRLHLPKLKGKDSKEFFTDKVKYYYEHDSIHELMAHYDKPMYLRTKIDETVECHKSLFEALSYEDRVKQVLEECYVIALERCLYPLIKGEVNIPAFTHKDAFKYGLVRVSTNLTGGWFRKFAADNFSNIFESYDEGYGMKGLMNQDKLRLYVKPQVPSANLMI